MPRRPPGVRRTPGTGATRTEAHGVARSSDAVPAKGSEALPHGAGNQALQRQLRSSGARENLAISRPDDPQEKEADHIADAIVTRSSVPPIRGARGTHEQPLRANPLRGGEPLAGGIKDALEARLRRDLSDVRIHTDADAGNAAHAIGARAYTLGSDIAFAPGEYAPGQSDGERLLAHELVHVVQQEGDASPTLRRTVHGDPRHICITSRWAQALTDAELLEQENLLTNYLLSQTTLLAGTPGYKSAQMNIDVLREESRARLLREAGFGLGPPFGAPSGPTVPRPPALPLMQGYSLQALPNIPADLAARLPEGEIVDLSPGLVEGAGGGAYAGLSGANAALMNFGFAPAAGDFAIGIVAIPPASMNPLSPNFNPIDLAAPLERAGHSAVYVRQGGRITIVRGYNPQMSTPSSFWNVARNQGEIFSGRMGVPGEITADAALFQSTAARSVEFPVTEAVAAKVAAELPALGPPGAGQPPLYTAPPSEYGRITGTEPGCMGTNCGLWATQQAEAALGGRVGIAGEPPIVDVPVPGQASQGRLYGMLGRAQEGAPMAEMPAATGPAVPGQMSTGLKVLKWGGRVFLVGSIVKVGYDVWDAPPGEKTHVAVVGGAGIAGGFAGGAALGLFCGPGAPVCSVVTGIVGGILGGLGAGSLTELLWNAGPGAVQSLQWLGGHENPEYKEYYERQDRIKWQRAMGQMTEEDY